MIKLLPPTGHAILRSSKQAAAYAAKRLDDGCDVSMWREPDGRIRIEFRPSNIEEVR